MKKKTDLKMNQIEILQLKMTQKCHLKMKNLIV